MYSKNKRNEDRIEDIMIWFVYYSNVELFVSMTSNIVIAYWCRYGVAMTKLGSTMIYVSKNV